MNLVLAFLLLTFTAVTDPPLPDCIANEAALKAWVEKTVTDTPPPGGVVLMLKHWPPKYGKNDKVGEIWIVPAVVKITQDGATDHEMSFCVFHVDTKESEVKIEFVIPESTLQKYLETDPKLKSI